MYDPRVVFFLSATPSDSWMLSKKVMIWQKEMYRKYNFREQMALKAAAQHFTYSTVSATSSQDSQPADCDWTVCYMLALSCGGVLQKKNLCDSKWKWHSVSGVCVWICVVVLRDPSTPPEAKKKKSRVFFFDLCDVTRTLSCSSQGLNICNDCVLNKPPSCFFFYLNQVFCSFFITTKWPHTHACCT